MDCFNRGCPFRVNETSNANRCECTACPNKCTDDVIIVSNRTLTNEEIEKINEIRRNNDPDYGRGTYA